MRARYLGWTALLVILALDAGTADAAVLCAREKQAQPKGSALRRR